MQLAKQSGGALIPDFDFKFEKLSRAFFIRDANGVLARWGYTEFRANGTPPRVLGSPGDVYLNTKPGSYNLYANYATGWTKWPGPENMEITLVHPRFLDRYLWFKSDMSTFGWYPKSSLLMLPNSE
jgi:hypothetical protein